MSNTLSLTVVENEPRILDLQLAERLGFERPLNIRNLIKRNEAKLLSFGVLSTVEKTSGELGGRPTEEYYLNQKQAIFICMKSETDKAFDVQVEIVHVFDAYLNGRPASAAKPAPKLTREERYRLGVYATLDLSAIRDYPTGAAVNPAVGIRTPDERRTRATEALFYCPSMVGCARHPQGWPVPFPVVRTSYSPPPSFSNVMLAVSNL